MLDAGIMKHPSLREEYPALQHVWTPDDPELHFRAWYRGATNLYWLCLCAERFYRINLRGQDIVEFTYSWADIHHNFLERERSINWRRESPVVKVKSRLSLETFQSDEDSDEDAYWDLEDDLPVIEGEEEAVSGQVYPQGNEDVAEAGAQLGANVAEPAVEHVVGSPINESAQSHLDVEDPLGLGASPEQIVDYIGAAEPDDELGQQEDAEKDTPDSPPEDSDFPPSQLPCAPASPPSIAGSEGPPPEEETATLGLKRVQDEAGESSVTGETPATDASADEDGRRKRQRVDEPAGSAIASQQNSMQEGPSATASSTSGSHSPTSLSNEPSSHEAPNTTSAGVGLAEAPINTQAGSSEQVNEPQDQDQSPQSQNLGFHLQSEPEPEQVSHHAPLSAGTALAGSVGEQPQDVTPQVDPAASEETLEQQPRESDSEGTYIDTESEPSLPPMVHIDPMPMDDPEPEPQPQPQPQPQPLLPPQLPPQPHAEPPPQIQPPQIQPPQIQPPQIQPPAQVQHQSPASLGGQTLVDQGDQAVQTHTEKHS